MTFRRPRYTEMGPREAAQLALGYAWGHVDGSGVKTEESSAAFARAYATAWDEYYRDECTWVPAPEDAYRSWQASKGKSIFTKEDEPIK